MLSTLSRQVRGSLYRGTGTFENRPASARVGSTYFATNVGAEGEDLVYKNGFWRLNAAKDVYLNTTLATGDRTGNNQIIRQVLFPAGFLRLGRRIGINALIADDGTTDVMSAASVLLGTAGTTADTKICDLPVLATNTNRSAGVERVMLIDSATSIRVTGYQNQTGAVGVWGNAATGFTLGAAVTVPNIESGALYMSFAMDMGGTTDAPQIQDVLVTIWP